MKALSYDALMALDAKAIEEMFPFGAHLEGKGRWRPTTVGDVVNPNSKDHRPLRHLLRDKKKRIEQPRLLHRDSSRGYTHDPHMALRHEPEAVDRESQRRFSEEARAKEDNRRAVMRSRLAQLRQLGIEQIKQGKDPTPILDKALQDFEEAA